MVRAVHDKLNALCNSAEFSDYQFIAHKIVVVCNMTFKVLAACFTVVIICIVPNNYILIPNNVFNIAYTWYSFIRVDGIGVWSVHKITFFKKRTLKLSTLFNL